MRLKSDCISLLLFAVLSLSQLNPSPTSIQQKHLQVGTEYTFKLQPNSSLLLFTNSSSPDLYIDFSSTFPFESCPWGNQQCKAVLSQHKMREGSIQLNQMQISSGLMIKNPHSTLYLKLELSVHEVKDGCRPLSARQLYSKQLSGNLCFVHDIQSEKDMEVMLQSERFQNINHKFTICKKNIELPSLDGNRFFLSQATILQNCNGFQEKQLKIEVSNALANDSSSLMIVLQYPDEPVLLLDGIGYSTSLKATAKLFAFQLVNTLNTTINVQSKESVEIFAKVVKEQMIDQTVPNEKLNDFSSKSGIIFLYYKPFLTITKEELMQIDCKGCFLVISLVLRSEKQEPQDVIVQVVQHSSVLTEGKMKHNYLPKESIAYYSYSSTKAKVIYLQISDNNQYCSKVYFSTSQSPSQTNHLFKYEKKQIVYSVKRDQNYYLAVQATANCAYSLVIYDSTNNITYLEKGRFGYLNLQQGQSKVFLVMADSSQYLKFISIHLYGKVHIYLNRTTLLQINSLQSYKFNFSSFQKSGQYQNRLVIQKEDEIFCERCYYLVGIVADKHTESSLFYGDQHTPIPIRDKRVNDLIPKKGTIVKGQYYGLTRSKYEVKVKSGKLRVSFINGDNSFEKEYSPSKKNYKDEFDLQKEQGILDKIVNLITNPPVIVEFQALEDNTVYSIKVTSKETKKDHPSKAKKCNNVSLTPGQDEYQMVTPLIAICASGHLRDKNERVIITSDYKQKDLLDNLNVTALINHRQAQLKIQKAQNIISISFPSLSDYLMNAAVSFELIISITTAKLWFFILQEEDFSVLPPQVDYLVNEQYTFITHAQADLVVDLFECKGKANMIFSSSVKELSKQQQKQLDEVSIGNQLHAIRVNRFSTTFFRVNAAKAIIRWFPMDIQNHLGTGYLDYQVGHLLYASAIKGVQLTWTSLTPKKKTKNKVINVNYTLFVAADEESLKAASQCELIDQLNIYKQTNILTQNQSLSLNSTFIFTLRRDTLAKQFTNQPLFATIVADVQILPNGQINISECQRYRFIYQYTQIPSQVLATTYIDHISSMDNSQLVVIALISLLLITAIVFICLQKILPLLGILKNRLLVEQVQQPRIAGTEAQQGLSQIPPSSDRRGVHENEMMEKDDYIEAK